MKDLLIEYSKEKGRVRETTYGHLGSNIYNRKLS